MTQRMRLLSAASRHVKKQSARAALQDVYKRQVWGMVWGALLFQEDITLQKCIGAAIIVVGVILYAFCLLYTSFANRGIPVSTARAGNVIGGGDFAKDRIVPDLSLIQI